LQSTLMIFNFIFKVTCLQFFGSLNILRVNVIARNDFRDLVSAINDNATLEHRRTKERRRAPVTRSR